LLLFSFTLKAQFENAFSILTDPSDSVFKNQIAGEFTPAKGFQLIRSDYGSLNLSLYAMARWVDQMPGEDTWYDHRDSLRIFDGRNDIYWHRVMLWFTGFLGTPKLTYMATVWTVTTTQQTLVYGNIMYKFNDYVKVGIGITPNNCVRSLQGPFPFFTSTDRTMAEDGLRGGFTNGIFAMGQITPTLRYSMVLGNNLSILGIKASNLTRHYSKSISLSWMPTTGEFGPRGGNGDLEYHKKIATRFGASYCHSRENRFNNTGTPAPDNTQVRLSDGVLFFETGALAPGVTVVEANYDIVAVDLGLKYKGFALHTEMYYRTLSKMNADGPLPLSSIIDKGYTLQALYMAIPKRLCIYGVNSMVIDEFNRNPYEIGGGVNIYPLKTRSWRINLQAMYLYKCAAGGTFGLYTAGQTGTTLTIGTDILL
ncbi:MAG: hypothetical protein H6Q21_2211, partial [Bacteroidetes bacterium]|nr:hypothetical protein [Bacteroidota bacterium]